MNGEYYERVVVSVGHLVDFCRAMLFISVAYAVMRCLCVCPSVMLVHAVNIQVTRYRFIIMQI